MPKFALIQDGTETARQRFADVLQCFERCCEELSDSRLTRFSLEVFADESVAGLLDNAEPDEWACLVFASNALLSGEVEDAIMRERASLHRYLSAGGGLVVLHQQRDSLAPLLPEALLPELSERSSKRGRVFARAADDAEDDILLRYPTDVDCGTLRDFDAQDLADLRAQGHAIDLASFHFKALGPGPLPPALKPVVVSSAGEIVVARSQDHVIERVVIATPPLDTQGTRPGQGAAARALLGNAIRFAALGRPRRLVWYRPQHTDNELLLRWLNLDGAAAVHPAPPVGDGLDRTDAWLLGGVDAFVLPASRLEDVERLAEASRFLHHGGAIVATEVNPEHPVTRITALVGRYEERRLASDLYAQLRAVDGWRTVKYAFELRNIVSALTMLDRDKLRRADPVAIAPASLDDLVAPLCQKLATPEDREDLGSSIALAECLAHITPADEPVDEEAIGWLEAERSVRSFDAGLQIRALLAFARRTPDPRFLQDAVEPLQAHLRDSASIAPVVRVLDAIALLDQAELLGTHGAGADRIAALVAPRLRDAPRLGSSGWMSMEATAEVTLGLIALHRRRTGANQALDEEVVAHIATGATALRRMRRRYRADPKGTAWLARLTHAVIVADRHFPIGLQRLATLEWSDRSPNAAGERWNQAVVEDLSLRNEQLRLGKADADRELVVRQAELDEQRLAGRLGRATATILPVLLLGAAFVAVVLQIGWSSLGGVLANIAVLLGVLLTVLGWIFAVLKANHLLAGPAVRLRDWMEAQGAPVIAQLAKVKRG